MYQNFILLSDSYKTGHWLMDQEGVEDNYFYFGPRKGAKYEKTVFFGLQALLLEYLSGNVVDNYIIDEAKEIIDAHMGPGIFNEAGWRYIVEEHGGRLPVEIMAAQEGSVHNEDSVLFVIHATDPKCAWLPRYLETLLSHVWYTSTVASLSRHVKETYASYMLKTIGNTEGLDFKLHDFGCRGASSMETAALGGMAHLVNFKGTDTMPALLAAKRYYSADLSSLGFSVPASEHSIMTARGRAGEQQVVENLLKEFYSGILSVVIDSFDTFNFVNELAGKNLRDQILDRDGTFVFRPDSAIEGMSTEMQITRIMGNLVNHFGAIITDRGYIMPDPKVGVLWGDGIDEDGIERILNCLETFKYAATPVVGMGGGLLQKVNRDTQRFAMKCSAQKRNGQWVDIKKETPGKESKTGRFQDLDLDVVFRNGELLKTYTFDEVRENAAL